MVFIGPRPETNSNEKDFLDELAKAIGILNILTY